MNTLCFCRCREREFDGHACVCVMSCLFTSQLLYLCTKGSLTGLCCMLSFGYSLLSRSCRLINLKSGSVRGRGNEREKRGRCARSVGGGERHWMTSEIGRMHTESRAKKFDVLELILLIARY